MAVASRNAGISRQHIAVIGDGAMTAGMVFEAMNNAGVTPDIHLLVILNDNDMSISPPVGALNRYLARLMSGQFYAAAKDVGRAVLRHVPPMLELARKLDAQNPGRQIAAMIRARITDVEGLKRSEIMDWLDGNNGVSKNFPGLSSQCAEDLRDAFDEAECGIDTDVEITCAKCGLTYNVPIPFGSGFLAPATAIQQRRRARRHGAASSGS